jgi:ABC-type antimicrobial peptide transport system permease subunit
MIKNFLKMAWRNIIRHKANAFINVSGLALGMTCCLFIFLWVQDEENKDNFHKNGANLYAVYQTTTSNGQTTGSYSSPYTVDKLNGFNFLMKDIKNVIPDVKDDAFYATGYELPWGHPETFQYGDKIVKMNGSRAGADFFKMLSYPLIAGTAQSALSQITDIAISRKMAEVFFGSPANAIGKTLRYENRVNFMVSSVFENTSPASSLKFDFLFNWDAQQRLIDGWSSNSFQTFLLLAPNADPKQTEARINQYLLPRLANSKTVQLHIGLQKFGEQYLHSDFVNGKPAGGRIEYVRIFSATAIFILVIACINFMNLATARSVKRAKEVGVRKVAGSSRGGLIAQFFAESLVFSFLAILLSIVLVILLLPAFEHFTGKEFEFPLAQPAFIVSIFALALFTGLAAGSYPALYLSSLKPVRILKGSLRFTAASIWFRKGLTVFQFVLSIVLLIATIVITRQTRFIQNARLGYDRENMVYLRIEGELLKKNKYLLFKNEALKMPGIAMVDRTTEVPQSMDFIVTDDQIKWQGKPQNVSVGVKPASVGFDFVKLMKLQIVQGRDFSPLNATDSTDAFLVNEEAVKQMGMKNPLGQWVQAWNKRGHIIGVLKDFHTQSLHEPIMPVLFDVKEYEDFGVVLVRTQPGQTRQALQSLAKVYKEVNPAYPFLYQFVDQEYEKLYGSEQIISSLSIVFACVAILISSLGLLGLVMFSAQQRTREFGVRKVLGASLNQLMSLFAFDFVQLIFIAFLIAGPIGWYGSYAWLQGFAYRVDISWWVFAVAGISTLAIALLTLSYEAFRSATVNPVKSLRSE